MIVDEGNEENVRTDENRNAEGNRFSPLEQGYESPIEAYNSSTSEGRAKLQQWRNQSQDAGTTGQENNKSKEQEEGQIASESEEEEDLEQQEESEALDLPENREELLTLNTLVMFLGHLYLNQISCR